MSIPSTKHLTVGSECPPKVEGKLRLYGMRFCPFAQRVKLVLNCKEVLYDIVNINLRHKPEWLYNLHSEGKVPALDVGDKVLIDSLGICEYLETAYPDPPLYPADLDRKSKDKEMIQKFGKITSALQSAFHGSDKPLSQITEEAIITLQEFEDELAGRGTVFFGGEKPGMVDLMMWPWGERAKYPALLKNEEPTFPKENFPKLVGWKQAMQEYEPVKSTIEDPEVHLNFLRDYLSGAPNPNFDL